MHFLHNFDSWLDFVETAGNRSLRRYARLEHSRTNDDDFNGGASFEEAVEMGASRGWPDGLRRLIDVSVSAARPWVAAMPSEVYEVAGAYPLPPLAAAGDPAAMVDVGEQLVAQQPVVRLLLPLAASCGVPAEAWMINGAAILSVIDGLEVSGRSVELSVHMSTEGSANRVEAVIPVKPAGQAVDRDRLAFALAHPAVFRRLFFSLIEQSSLEAERDIGSGYGRPRMPTDEIVDGMIVLPPPDYSSTTVEECGKRAVAALGELGDLDIAWGLPTTFRVNH